MDDNGDFYESLFQEMRQDEILRRVHNDRVFLRTLNYWSNTQTANYQDRVAGIENRLAQVLARKKK